MANYGKIARLSYQLREQLNLRLLDNEPPELTLQWLNGLPELQAIVAEHFQGEPVSSANLSKYKHHGGYRDWLDRRDAHDFALSLQDPQAPKDPVLDQLSPELFNRCLLLRYAALARNLPDPETEPDAYCTRLRQLWADISRLRRDNFHQERLALEHERLALQQTQAQQRTEEAHWNWTERPDVHANLYSGLAPDTIAMIDRDRGVSPPPITFEADPKGPKA